jgi:hypothetical protein
MRAASWPESIRDAEEVFLASTTIAPIMCGCKEQKYSYVPGVVNVNENLSFVSNAFDLKSPSLSP